MALDKYNPQIEFAWGKMIEPITKTTQPSAITLKPPILSTKSPTINCVKA